MEFVKASDCSLMTYFGERERITAEAHECVRKVLTMLEREPIKGVRNLHPAYGSLPVVFDAVRWQHEQVEETLRERLSRLQSLKLPEPKMVEIPVCYGEEFGPDLNELAAIHATSAERIVELHSSATYTAYFLGFVPGFAYLGSLPPELATPRLASPRRKVPAGSVGIAGTQTGVYPFATSGGWRLIGRTPIPMVRADRDPLSVITIGDLVRFTPISREQFSMLERIWG